MDVQHPRQSVKLDPSKATVHFEQPKTQLPSSQTKPFSEGKKIEDVR